MQNFHAQFVNFFGRHIPIAVICEDLPNSKNYLEIDKYKKDNFGMPGVKLNYKVSNNSKEMMKHGIKNVTKLLKTAGAYKIDAYGPVRNTGWHISGTARMGTNKYNSVVDKFGQTHDIKNLFIIDSSIFPTSSAVNIASTIQALSLMITSNIKKTLENI